MVDWSQYEFDSKRTAGLVVALLLLAFIGIDVNAFLGHEKVNEILGSLGIIGSLVVLYLRRKSDAE